MSRIIRLQRQGNGDGDGSDDEGKETKTSKGAPRTVGSRLQMATTAGFGKKGQSTNKTATRGAAPPVKKALPGVLPVYNGDVTTGLEHLDGEERLAALERMANQNATALAQHRQFQQQLKMQQHQQQYGQQGQGYIGGPMNLFPGALGAPLGSIGQLQPYTGSSFAPSPLAFGADASSGQYGQGMMVGKMVSGGVGGGSIMSMSEAEFMLRQVQTGGIGGKDLSVLGVGEDAMGGDSVVSLSGPTAGAMQGYPAAGGLVDKMNDALKERNIALEKQVASLEVEILLFYCYFTAIYRYLLLFHRYLLLFYVLLYFNPISPLFSYILLLFKRCFTCVQLVLIRFFTGK